MERLLFFRVDPTPGSNAIQVGLGAFAGSLGCFNASIAGYAMMRPLKRAWPVRVP
jgi:hypothetical protein